MTLVVFMRFDHAADTPRGMSDPLTCRFSRRLHEQVAGDAIYAAALTRPAPGSAFFRVCCRIFSVAAAIGLVFIFARSF